MGLWAEHPEKMTTECNFSAGDHMGEVMDRFSEGVIEVACWKIVYANPVSVSLFGLPEEELFTTYVPDLFDSYSRDMVESYLNTGKEYEGEISRNHLGSRQLAIHIIPIKDKDSASAIIFIKDITEQKRLEHQLRQSQKMEAIGTMAGGIAHDFNNILSAIMGYSEMSLYDISEKSPAREKITQVLKAGERAKNLVMQILAFSRQTEMEQKPVQIHLVVKEAMKLIRASIPTSITIRADIKTESDHVKADPTQIHQVIMNFCTNAHHAMMEHGGTMTICLEHFKWNGSEGDLISPELKTDEYMKLSVSDTGQGMDETVRERIFDPYFTTKKQGQGTGMGLAVVHGIVKSHGGIVTVESELGKGSTFSAFFPANKSINKPKVHKPIFFPRGTEHILLVDDEAPLVEIERQMLESLGYSVEYRASSVEALAAFKAKPEAFDLLITDMTMPNMNGDVLATEVLKIRSDIPIVLCTGFSEVVSPESAESMGIQGFLMKPLTLSDISNEVRRVLDSG